MVTTFFSGLTSGGTVLVLLTCLLIPIIVDSLSHAHAKVSKFIQTGSWCLSQWGTFDASSNYFTWKQSFSFTSFHLDRNDTILWDDMSKPRTNDIWDIIRCKGMLFPGIMQCESSLVLADMTTIIGFFVAKLQFIYITSTAFCYLCAGGSKTDLRLFL